MRPSARLLALAKGSAVFASFVLLAAATTWPLPVRFTTHVLGDPTGDTGVYLWNLWIFRHELIRHGHLPFSTDHVFSFTGGADFALHNYTPVAGLLGTPLIGTLGLVATFNSLMIAFIAAAGCGVFVLARRLGLSRAAAWMGGAVFMASPLLTARETAHLSLVMAAPLPFFVWALLRTLETMRARDAALVGVLCAIASYCDAYFGVYCVLMGAVIVGWRFTRVVTNRSRQRARPVVHLLDGLIAVLFLLIAWRLSSGRTVLVLAGIKIGLETLYTPMLAVSVLTGLRVAIEWWPTVHLDDPARRLRRLVHLGSAAVAVCLVMLSPVLIGIALRFLDDRLPGTEIFWRSSPRGVDLLAYAVPNPGHPWFGGMTSHWLLPDKPDAFPEFIGSFSLVALIVLGAAAWRRALPALWTGFTAFFVLLSLGPFLYVGGVNTYIPGPWAFLRYVPVIGMARSPSRFAIVAALGLSVLFAFAVHDWIHDQAAWLSRRWLGLSIMTAALALELVAVPRPLYSAAVPDVYRLVATTDDESGRLLELPTGIRDGTSSIGDFNASTQYFQTIHRRRLIGGYLSRVSKWRRSENLRAPVLRALFTLGEGHDISPELKRQAVASRDAFLSRSCVRYVIVNKRRATASLREFGIEALRLQLIHEDDDYELLAPIDPPPCAARPEQPRGLARFNWRRASLPRDASDRDAGASR